jgi:hypothetical protein
MSIIADPLFVQAEVAYRRESLAAGLPRVGSSPRHHASRVRWALNAPSRFTHRHGRHTPRPA